MKSYAFHVEMEPDEEGWRAYYPPWERLGASTWGVTRSAALQNIQDVLAMMLEEFTQEGAPIPPGDGLMIIDGPAVTVTV